MTFPLETRDALVDAHFWACARRIMTTAPFRVRIEDCLDIPRVRDIALIPLPSSARVALQSYDKWTVAATHSAGGSETELVRAYGMGMIANRFNKCLLSGSFEVCPHEVDSPWVAAAVAHVDPGDSGGPVLVRATDDRLATAIPEVAFVISQRRRSKGTPATTTCAANASGRYVLVMQPVWGLSMDGLVHRGIY